MKVQLLGVQDSNRCISCIIPFKLLHLYNYIILYIFWSYVDSSERLIFSQILWPVHKLDHLWRHFFSVCGGKKHVGATYTKLLCQKNTHGFQHPQRLIFGKIPARSWCPLVFRFNHDKRKSVLRSKTNNHLDLYVIILDIYIFNHVPLILTWMVHDGILWTNALASQPKPFLKKLTSFSGVDPCSPVLHDDVVKVWASE